MGYENIDGSSADYNVGCHLIAPDQRQHILMDVNPYMLDDATPKTQHALALKGLRALDGESVVLLNQSTVNSHRGDLDDTERTLNEAGLVTIRKPVAEAETPTESAE